MFWNILDEDLQELKLAGACLEQDTWSAEQGIQTRWTNLHLLNMWNMDDAFTNSKIP